MTRILIVEDDPALRNSIRSVLERNGYDVRTAGDGAAHRNEIVLVPAGAVQKEERSRPTPGARLEAVNERRSGHHANASIGGNEHGA